MSTDAAQEPERKRESTRESTPTRLGAYTVRAQIGEGGMATVYVGRDGARLVALKVIKEEFLLNREFVNMFVDEAKIVSRLQHPNLIDVYEQGSEGARLYIAMELLRGQSLWHVWMACRDQHVRLRYDMTAWIGARIAEGLHHAHEAKDDEGKPLGVVHRDVNASNIFLTYDGQVKVIDFGLAKGANRVSKTAAGVVKGKFAYMSPEQALGKPIDRRTDIFALAATLWELTVDRRLFKGKDDFETLRKVSQAQFREPRTLVEGFPSDFADVLRRALDRDRTKRYATALEFARALDVVAASEGRVIGPAMVGEVMRELFAAERAREQEWLADASAADRPAPAEALRPPEEGTPPVAKSRSSRSIVPTRPPPEGLFAPPAVRPPVDPNAVVVAEPEPETESRPPRDVKRAVLMALGTLILLVLAMLIGAWWGRR